ncbi:MAG: glycosyltransferase [Bacteroidetes bacterium]|nr:glycosyltransferase [Bacteroidota bacterium]
MREIGYESVTLMTTHYVINSKNDYNEYFEDMFKDLLKIPILKWMVKRNLFYLIFINSVKRFDIFHIPLHGFVLRFTWLKKWESQLIHFAGKKVIVLPYGGDIYRYSKIHDPSLRHALILSYPGPARSENLLEEQFNRWVKDADFFLPFFQIDSVGRWDSLPFSAVVIDCRKWTRNIPLGGSDGINTTVKIIHTPNHRGFKGSEFIINVVNRMKEEGFKVELILLEKRSNDDVLEAMRSADILIEQLIATAYALSGIEGMACGLPVISNLESDYYTQVFRRYSYLNECPIYSASPENLYERLKELVISPGLRKELGIRGRKYVEKYHSYKFAQTFFPKIYENIWNDGKNDLITYFDPNNPNSYNNTFSNSIE